MKAIETRRCAVEGCDATLLAKGLCRLHWGRQYRTGSTDAPQPRRGSQVSTWKGDNASYTAVHLRMSSQPRPEACEECGTTEGRFEWALRADAPSEELLEAPQGWKYSTNPAHYRKLCKSCHNHQDLWKDECKRGHRLSGDNLYIQPSNGKRFCRACQVERRRRRWLREKAARVELNLSNRS